MAESCPEREALAAFAAGNLPRARFEAVALHVEQCGRCSQELADLENATDPILTALREPGEGESPDSWAVPEGVRKALLSLSGGNTPPIRLGEGDTIGTFVLV